MLGPASGLEQKHAKATGETGLLPEPRGLMLWVYEISVVSSPQPMTSPNPAKLTDQILILAFD